MGLGAFFGMLQLSTFISELNNISSRVDDSLDVIAQKIIDLALNEIKSNLYPGHGYLTGQLHDSYNGSYIKSGASVDITVGTDIYYAPYVEFKWGGRCAHFIPAIQIVEYEFPNIIRSEITSAIDGGYTAKMSAMKI